MENFIVEGPNCYLSAWKNGAFWFEGCDDRKLTDVKVIQKMRLSSKSDVT